MNSLTDPSIVEARATMIHSTLATVEPKLQHMANVLWGHLLSKPELKFTLTQTLLKRNKIDGAEGCTWSHGSITGGSVMRVPAASSRRSDRLSFSSPGLPAVQEWASAWTTEASQ